MKKLFKILSTSGDTLKQRVLISGFWIASFKIIERVLRFIKTIIIARLLAPSDFGLFGIACLSMEIFQTFTETGIQSALVQKKGDIKPYLNTAWTIQLLRGIGLFVVVFIFAPQFGKFFNNLNAIPVIRVIAFNMLFYGLTNIGITYFEKEIEFGKQRLVDLARLTVEFIVSLSLAFILRNAWALVWGMIAGRAANCLASYIAHPYRPKFDFDIKRTKELMHFGKWMFCFSIVIFLINQGDDILVGKILGATALGFYTMAYAISNLVATEITHLISQVAFPAYAKLKDDIVKLREAYLKIFKIISFIVFPITGVIFILGGSFTKLFLGEKWLSMVIPMQILCFFGLFRSLSASMGPIFLATGKPKIDTKIVFYQLIILSIIIYPLTVKFGIAGTSLATLVALLITRVTLLINISHILKTRISTLLESTVIPVVATIIMVLFVWLAELKLKASNIYIFTFYLILSLVSYLLLMYLFQKNIFKEIKQLLKMV